MRNGPAYRLVTERLVLRAMEPGDAEELCALLASNQQHLRPWVEWARDAPRTVDGVLDVVRRMRGRFDVGESFSYGLFARRGDPARENGAMIGGLALSPNWVDSSATLGYWLAESSLGQGLATEAVGALTCAAFEIERFELVEIHCAARNEKSLAVARRAGFVLDGTWRARLRAEDGTRTDRTTFSLTRAEYEARATRTSVTAHDALGRPLIEAVDSARRASPFR